MAQPARDPAFRKYLEIQKRFDARTIRILEASARDIQRRLRVLRIQEGIGAQVRAAQLRVTLNAIHEEIASLWRAGVTDVVMQGGKAAAEAAEIAVETISRVVYASLPDEASSIIVRGLQRAGRAGIDSLYARVPRALSERVYRDGLVSRGAIDDLVRQGLAQGLSAKELAGTVYRFVSPTTPGGVSYAAMRLARTEINNAFHQQQIAVGRMPGVNGVKWNLSGSHPKPDICNEYADSDHEGLGPGVFSVDNVPPKPHPHCFCFLTYVTMTTTQFKKALTNGDFDDELRKRIGLNMARLKGAL